MPRAVPAAVVLVICLAARHAPAEEFSWDLSAVAERAEHDPFIDADLASVQATYHLDPVDDTTGPYALASFLDPSTRVYAVLSREQQTFAATGGGPPPSISVPERVTTREEYSIGGRYLLRPSKWYFGGRYGAGDTESSPAFPTAEWDLTSYGVIAGKYLGAATTLEATYDSWDSRSESPYVICVQLQFCINAGTLTRKERRDRASVQLLHVRRFRSMTYSLSARIAASGGDITIGTPETTLPNLNAPPFFGPVPGVTIPARTATFSIPRLTSYSMAGQLFPMAKLGVRVGYSRWDDDTPADDAYEVSTSWFFTHHVALELVLSRQTIDETTGSAFTDADFRNMDGTAVRVVGRF